MRYLAWIIFALFALLCIIIAVSNPHIVRFSLHPLPLETDLPVYLLLFLGLFIGLGGGWLVAIRNSFRNAKLRRRQELRIRDLEKELKSLSSPAVHETNGPNQAATE